MLVRPMCLLEKLECSWKVGKAMQSQSNATLRKQGKKAQPHNARQIWQDKTRRHNATQNKFTRQGKSKQHSAIQTKHIEGRQDDDRQKQDIQKDKTRRQHIHINLT
jgi:hypothetical protein